MSSIQIHPDALTRLKEFRIDGELGFGKIMAPVMVKAVFEDGAWGPMELLPYGALSITPHTSVLHYGQEIFEGMKAYRQENGEVNLFRPEFNAHRFAVSAERMALPVLPEEDFLEAVETMAAYCSDFIPRGIGESLYIRPFMFAAHEGLGVKPSQKTIFMVIASPSGSYFSGKSKSVNVFIERTDSRSAPGGIGYAKTGGNYAASLRAALRSRDANCEQTLWLDACEKKYVEEASGMNFYAVIDGALHTPPAGETILNGCTRDSILKLGQSLGYRTVEAKIDVDKLLDEIKAGRCEEVFLCGTAAIVTPVASMTDGEDGTVYHLREPEGSVSMKLRRQLLDIQHGRIEDEKDWIRKVSPEVAGKI